MFTEAGKVLQPQTTPWGRPTPSTGQLKCKIVISGLKKANKYSVMSPPPHTHRRIRFICPKCNVGLCVNVDKI